MKTTTTPKRIVWLTFMIWALGTGPLQAQEPSQQQAALKLIKETAADICTTVPIQGHDQNVDLTGAAQAKLAGVLGKVADLGIDGAAKYQSGEYKGVLRQELATAIKNGNDCKLSVFNALMPKLLLSAPAQPSGSPQPKSADPIRPEGEFQGPPTRLRIVGRNVQYTKWLDGTQTCWNGDVCAIASIVLENPTEKGFTAAIRGGSTSIGPCRGSETDATGLDLFDNHPGWSNNVRFEQAKRYISPGETIPITIKLSRCSPPGTRTVDVSITLTIATDSEALKVPLIALNVPVK